jgi:hypothetical protein
MPLKQNKTLKPQTMKKKLEKRANQLFNELVKSGIYTSYKSILETMYETASEKKNYKEAHYINELIAEEINS